MKPHFRKIQFKCLHLLDLYSYQSNKMHVCMALNGNGNRIWNSPEMPADTWFKLQIGQYFEDKKYIYKIWINDELKLSVINNLPMIFE